MSNMIGYNNWNIMDAMFTGKCPFTGTISRTLTMVVINARKRIWKIMSTISKTLPKIEMKNINSFSLTNPKIGHHCPLHP